MHVPEPFVTITTIASVPREYPFNQYQVTYDSDGGCYELLTFGSMDGGSSGAGADPNELRRGSCLAAVFLARNRFAVLDKNRQVGGWLRAVVVGCHYLVASLFSPWLCCLG